MKDFKFAICFAATLGFLAVALGAFGAHALKEQLVANGKFETFETAVRYQYYGVFTILLFSILNRLIPHKNFIRAVWAYIIGTVLFSGSLYIICFLGISAFGMVAPIGGLCFLLSWALVFYTVFKMN